MILGLGVFGLNQHEVKSEMLSEMSIQQIKYKKQVSGLEKKLLKQESKISKLKNDVIGYRIKLNSRSVINEKFNTYKLQELKWGKVSGSFSIYNIDGSLKLKGELVDG